MKKSLFLRIFGGYLLVILMLSGAILVFSFSRFKAYHIESVTQNMASFCASLRVQARPYLQAGRARELDSLFKGLNPQIPERITVIDPSGAVLADSIEDPRAMENHSDRPEIAQAMRSGIGTALRYSTTERKKMLYVALPVRSGGRLLGVIRLSYSLRDINAFLDGLQFTLLQITMLLALLALLFALVFARNISRPIRVIGKAAQRIADGDFDTRVPIKPGDTFGDLAGNFNNMAGRLQAFFDEMKKLEKIKKDFVSNISHELRTPLSSIKGYIETMEENADGTDRRYIEIIKRNTERLSRIVEDLLLLSELEETGMALQLENVRVPDVVRDAVGLFEQRAGGKGLQLAVHAPGDLPVIRADRFKLEQALINLLDNAIKYTDRGSVAVSARQERGEMLLQVSDTGPGIPPEHLDRIFERFYVVDKSRSRKLGGTGLGLSIVKHIVLLHGGQITVTSTPGAGTTFTITLPAHTV